MGRVGVCVAVRRGSACVVFDVELDGTGPALTGWDEGPLPVAFGDGAAADRGRRMTYFEARVGESLYGTPARPARWHRRQPPGGPDGAVEAVEVLALPAVVGGDEGRRGLAVVHVRLGNAPLAEMAHLADLAANGERYGGLLPAGARMARSARRAWTMCHVTFADGHPPSVMPSPYAQWGARDQWLWLLASATPPHRFPPDPEDHELFAGRVRMSADWQALVLRDGTAFLGTSPDPGDGSVFHATAEVLVHTLYLDAFLLGRLQVLGVNALANSLAGLSARQAHARRLQVLEGRLIELRRALWSSHITSRAKANELLERFQEQHRLPQLLVQVGTGLGDTARYVEAGRTRRGALAVGLLSAVGLPFGIAYAAGALWGEPGPLTLLVSTVVAVVVTGLMFVVLPPLRGFASDELRKTED
jgi:hypothetical protein